MTCENISSAGSHLNSVISQSRTRKTEREGEWSGEEVGLPELDEPPVTLFKCCSISMTALPCSHVD